MCIHILQSTAVSPFLYCFTMSWWVGGSLRGFQCCTTYCCTAVVLLYCCCTGLWVGRSVLSCRVLLSCVHTGSWVCLFLFLPLYRPRAGIVKRAASDYYSGVLILSFTKKKIVRACSMFYPYEGYRSVTPLDAARVNRTNLKNEAEHV